jgi:hypothetical protein
MDSTLRRPRCLGSGGSPNRQIECVAIKHIQPVAFVSNQTSSYRILPNVCCLFVNAFITSQTMVKKVSLPFNSTELRTRSLEIPNYVRKRRIARDRNEGMQVVRHQKKQS